MTSVKRKMICTPKVRQTFGVHIIFDLRTYRLFGLFIEVES